MTKLVPQADAKSASMGWFFDPGFIQNVQRVAADVENPSMESIDSVLFALREMGYIRTAATCEHGFSVDECVTGLCELQTENASLRARVARMEEALTPSADTKAAYMGEFSMRIPEFDENGEEYMCSVNVPWITIKDIMKAIMRKALEDK